eukprot:Skav225087  [mRNA]  locus=scaffold1341:89099:90994:- [translate_table: standard]
MGRLFYELGISQRLSTKLAVQICTTKARALAIPAHFIAASIFRTASKSVGHHWFNEAAVVESVLGVGTSFEDHAPSVVLLSSQMGPQAVRNWKLQVLLPAAQLLDRDWFTQQAIRWHFRPSPVLAQLRGRTRPRFWWKFLRAWMIARVSKTLPLSLWKPDLGNPQVLASCPCCGQSDGGLAHIVTHAPGQMSILEPSNEWEIVEDRVIQFGAFLERLVEWDKLSKKQRASYTAKFEKKVDAYRACLEPNPPAQKKAKTKKER